MYKSEILTEIEQTEIDLERIRDVLLIAYEMISNDSPSKPYNPNDDKSFLQYLYYGERAHLLCSLVDTAFTGIKSICESLTKLIEEP